MNLDKIFEKMEARSNIDSDFYTIKEGSNKMRIMTDFVEVSTINRKGKYAGLVSADNKPQAEDQVQLKGWAWALIRKNEGDELKIVQFGSRILKQLVAYRNDPDYSFDTMPMPYDIDLKASGAGTKEVSYTVIPARHSTDVSSAEMEALNKKKAISYIVDAIIAKQSPKSSQDKTIEEIKYPTEKINAEDIPF